ncbi:hypothetical protein [Hippea alviniae]|uniref:hypothetical protein n=1 Tax=Hippea alviniae TaxID=1279027 RepID=UPI0003B4175C|nr:hypothetical protein [Hippea alviniae]
MQIEVSNLRLNITPQQLKNLLKVGERVEAFVVSKKGDFKYIVRLKGKLFEASSNIPINSKKVLVEVKSLAPQIVLKLLEPESSPKTEKIASEVKNITQKEIKSLFVFEENSQEAEVIQRKSDGRYLISIKGKLLEIETEKPINSNLISLLLDDEGKIKIVEKENLPVDFVKQTSAIIINDAEKLIAESIEKLKQALDNNDRLTLISLVVKLKNITEKKELKELLSKAEENLIREKNIKQDLIKTIIDKLSAHLSNSHDDIEKLSNLIKESIRQFGAINSQNQENLFVFLPFVINGKEEKVFIKKENLASTKGKKAFKISLLVSHSSYGAIVINGLSIEDSTSISIFFSNKRAFEKFKSMEGKIKNILGGVNLYIGISDIKPVINEKRLNVKI